VRASFFLLFARILIASILALPFSAAIYAQTEDIAQLKQQAEQLFKAGKYGEAHAAAERTVQLAKRGQNTERIARALGSTAWYALFARLPETAVAASERALKLAPHLLFVETNHAHALLFLDRIEEARAIYLGHKGEPLGEQGKWEVVVAQDFKELRLHGLDHPTMAAIEAMLANAADSPRAQSMVEIAAFKQQVAQLYGQGEYIEATPIAEEALAIAEKALGAEHPDTLGSVNSLAALYVRRGRYGESEPLLKRALAGREKALGREHPDTLGSIDSLGAHYGIQRRYGEAEPLLKRALAGWEKALGLEHPSTLAAVNSLAVLYQNQGRYGESEPLLKRVLAGREKALGPEHPDTLRSIDSLGAHYDIQGRYSEAEPLLERALAGWEKALGLEHPSTLAAVNSLAVLYQNQGRYGESEPLLKRVLAGRERALGPEHPSTLTSVHNLGALYDKQGRYSEAGPLLKQALAGREKALGAEHPETLTSVNSLAALYVRQGRYGESEPLLKQALAGYEQALGPEHPLTLHGVDSLAALYQRQGRHSDSEPLLKRALAGREKVLGREHPETLRSANNLGFFYQSRGRYSESEPLLKRALAGREKALGREHPDTLTSIASLGAHYDIQGRYSEAEPLLKRALAGWEKALGLEHPSTLAAVNGLAVLYQNQGRYGESEPLFERALAGYERALGPEHPEALQCVNNLGLLYQRQGRYSESEPLLKRALVGREKALGPEHPDTLRSVHTLGIFYDDQGRYSEAAPLYKRALAGHEQTLGPEHPSTLVSINSLGLLYQRQGRYSDAEPLYRRALPGWEKALGPEHPDTLRSVNNLAGLYEAQGRRSEAEPLYKRALTGWEKALGPEHPDTLTSVNNLAALYEAQGRHSEAEPLYKRALAGWEKALGPEHPLTLTSVNNLADLYRVRTGYAEAEPLYRRALAGWEKALGPEHPDTLTSVNNLAALYEAQGRHSEAEPLYERALAGHERSLGAEHPLTLISVNNLGFLYERQGRLSEATQLYKRALAGYEKILGAEHPNALISVNNLGFLYFAQRDWHEANQYWRHSTAAIARRVQRGALDAPLIGKIKTEAQRNDWQFWGLVKAAYRLAPEGPAPRTASEMFETAQWALGSEAAQSLAQMAARGMKGDLALAALVRERQDLVDEWQRREKIQAAVLGQDQAKRNIKAEAENRDRMEEVDGRIAAIDNRLKSGFPDFFAQANPTPLPIEEVQAQLGATEALVLFLDIDDSFQPTPEETFIWVVTKTDMRWLRSDLGKAALAREVAALRCGLDYAAWIQGKCEELTGKTYNASLYPRRLPPFDPARAHHLYNAMLGGAEDLIKDKTHLLLVPSGALTQLPPQVLVTEPPAAGEPTQWLIRDRAVSILPAVSSLKALRTTARPSAAERPMIGFGNPLLDGPNSGYAKYAEEARQKQSCPRTAWERIARLFELDRGIKPFATRGLVDPKEIRYQPPLPETADELCAVARDTGADLSQIRLGARATEREVKSLSERGELARYRLVEFATHGVMAGQFKPAAEPGLILTPPGTASEVDDGYLTASEVAGLRLDADWVILSACNTAAGQATSAEALSGLARAFIYAQARALLVSHWEVDSDAAVKLVTTAVRRIARDKTMGRAEALRQAMLALIDSSDAKQQHPSTWAPFVVVGEGGR
jgi:CHAT domain-containing protein/Tfp pilus assembly protein PilF